MCGIAGYVGRRRVDDDRVAATHAVMGRRGPDAVGAWRHQPAPDRHLVLLHSRLSIIDLDARAHQPMHVGGHVIVYNGELYNYRELTPPLVARGGPMATTSDTEVLVRAWQAKGEAVLDEFEGMWAFALYDVASGILTLCRDRFGEKPLYLHQADHGLYFGSEIKFLSALSGHRFPVDVPQLYRYLINGYKSLHKQTTSFFDGVRELEPATVMSISPTGDTASRRYWTLDPGEDEGMSSAQAVSAVRESLIRSVGLRLRADVPLAFCMSGGVDSNALISIARRVYEHDVHGFTVVNDDARYEESAEVAHAVEQLGIRHTEVPVTTSAFLSNLRELVRHHDAPIYTISYYVHWLMMGRIADHGYRISVSGTAADELFTGYYDHHNLYLHAVSGTAAHGPALEAWTRHVAPIVRNPYLQNPRLYDENPRQRDHIYLDSRGFASYLKTDWWEGFDERDYAPSLLRNRMLNELFHEAVPAILHEDDLNAMYFSIENRSPFLDRHLVELTSRIPSAHLIQDGKAKAILREACRGIVPDRILDNRRKVGFNAPIRSILATDDPAVRARVLADGPIWKHVRRDRIEQLMDAGDLPNSQSKFLFYFVCAQAFLEEFDPT